MGPEGALAALDDRAMWNTLQEEADGSGVVTFGVPNLEAAARTVLSYAPHTVVLEPDELRRQVRERALATAKVRLHHLNIEIHREAINTGGKNDDVRHSMVAGIQ